MDIFSVFTLLGGLALFLYGMDVMGDGLKRLSGGQLESILSRLTSNRFMGFLLGFVVTAIIQSSSATTVMLVGFVNSGIMRLTQTIGVILGANLGTTVTSWILSLTNISGDSFFIKIFQPSSFTPLLALIGIIMIMAAKSEKRKCVGTIFIGFAVLMFGMEAMSGAMEPLKESESFKKILVMFQNPVLGILSGTILTAIIQSSSASVGILQALSLTGAIPFSTAIPIILGQNIGTTITPILSALTANRDAKRVAIACLYIKLIGVIVVCAAFYGLNALMGGFWFMQPDAYADPFTIAVVHTLFNIFNTVLLLPFCNLMEKLAIMTFPDKGEGDAKDNVFSTLDERFLDIPSFAVETSFALLCKMAEETKNSIIASIGLLDKYDAAKEAELVEKEGLIDAYEDKLGSYLVKVSASPNLLPNDSKKVSEYLHLIGDIERMSDHALNICQAAKEIDTKKLDFSQQAKKEISVVRDAIIEIVELTTKALVDNDLELAKKVEPLEQTVDSLKHKIKRNHIKRLQDGDCTVEMGFILSDVLTNYERVSDHCSNIAACLLESANDSLEVHQYLNHVKQAGENEFFELYASYKDKYKLG